MAKDKNPDHEALFFVSESRSCKQRASIPSKLMAYEGENQKQDLVISCFPPGLAPETAQMARLAAVSAQAFQE